MLPRSGAGASSCSVETTGLKMAPPSSQAARLAQKSTESAAVCFLLYAEAGVWTKSTSSDAKLALGSPILR